MFSGPPPRRVFSGVDLDLAAGDYVAVMGESDIGKSTLLNLIAGLDHPESGTIEIGGTAIGSLDDDALTRLRRAKVGFVFQAFHLLPYLDVAQNIALPLSLNNVPDTDAAARVADMLGAVGLADRASARPSELSGGEMQRVAIARALVHRPALVLADEPTGNLDPESAKQVAALLRDAVKREGAAGLLVTHSLEAARSADRILVLGAEGLRAA